MKLPDGTIKDQLKRVRDSVRTNRYRFGRGAIYYRVASRAIDREADAVFAGIKEHHLRVRTGSEVFELRRRIHMIEKGLTMRPRRDTFAVAYINMVLERLSRVIARGLVSEEFAAWARDVLDAYFQATAASADPVISRARDDFARMKLESPLPYSGPTLPPHNEEPVSVSALADLAERRRSIRWFTDKRVDRSSVDRAVRIALEAPTACNRVPYRIRLFDDPEDARRIASVAGGTAGYVHNINALAVVVGDLSAYVDERDRHLIYIDGSLAAMSFVLGLESQGIASCCINWPDIAKPERTIRDLLRLAPYERVIMLIAYGHADPSGLAPISPKIPLNDARTYEELK